MSVDVFVDAKCRFAIKETNFVLNCNSSFTACMTDSSWYEYDWWH